MKITVIVPTYRRPQDLERCLGAIKRQTRPVEELLIIVRDSDSETWDFVERIISDFPFLRPIKVKTPGVVAALNTGLDHASGDIISITDDDAAPHPDWLERIEAFFVSDSNIGGVGGRDWVYHGTELEDGSQEVVGKLQWFGRIIGNHHIGIGKSQEVDFLKGVNMSFRRLALANLHFDERMSGSGAQVNFEIAFCLTLRRTGWKLIYDPNVAVNHHRGQRFDEDQRDRFNSSAFTNAVHNETLALLDYLSPIRRYIFILWAILVGSRGARGVVQWVRFLPKEGRLDGQEFIACLRGRWLGWQTWKRLKSPAGETK
jgi:glycosyltransferase involved in cell wall biosynthesis